MKLVWPTPRSSLIPRSWRDLLIVTGAKIVFVWRTTSERELLIASSRDFFSMPLWMAMPSWPLPSIMTSFSSFW